MQTSSLPPFKEGRKARGVGARARRFVFQCLLGALMMLLVLPAAAQQDKKKDPALEKYFNANGLFNRKLYPLAAEEYEDFLKTYKDHPKTTDVQFGLGLSYYGMKKFDAAAPLLKKLAGDKNSPRALLVHLYLGNSLRELKKPVEAESVFKDGLSIKGGAENAQLRKGLLECLFDQKKWKQVIPEAEKLAGQAGAVGVRASYQGGIARFEQGDFKEAAQVLEVLKGKVKGNEDYEQTTLYMLAESRRELKEFDAAEAAYEAAADLKTRKEVTADALYRLGRVRFDSLKEYPQAAEAFGKFTRDFKEHKLVVDAGVYLGRSQLEAEEFAKAENVFGGLAGDNALIIEVPLWQARTFFRQKKHTEAVKVLEAARGKFANNEKLPELLFDLGNNHYELNAFPEASKAFQTLIADHGTFPQMDDAMRLCADSLHREKKYGASHDLCGEFLSKYPNDKKAGDVAFLQCENLFLQDKYKEAVEGFKTFADKYSGHPQAAAANYRIGSSYYNQKEWMEALKVLEPLARDEKVRSRFKQIDYLVGDCKFRTKQWVAAIKSFDQFVEASPEGENADAALLMSGLASQQAKDTKTAIATLTKLTDNYSGSGQLAQAYVEIGRMQYLEKELDKARVALEVVKARHNESKWLPDAEYYLGFVARDENKLTEAVEHFAVVADRHAKHNFAGDSRFQQGIVLLQQEDFKAAQGALEKLLVDYPKYNKLDEATYRLGWALEQQEDWDAALKEYSKVAGVKADGDWIDNALYQSAWCEKGAGRDAMAMETYKKLLAEHPQSDLVNRGSFELAELEFQAKMYTEAADRLSGLLKLAKDAGLKSRAQYRLAWSKFELEEFASAATAFEDFGGMLPNNPPQTLKDLTGTAAYQAGEARMKLAEAAGADADRAASYKAAQANYEKAVAEKNGGEVVQSQSLLRLGECQGRLDNWKDSQSTHERFIQAFPGHRLVRNAWQGLGWAQENQGDIAAAITSYQKVTAELRKDELGARAQFHIGECHLKLARKSDDSDAKADAFKSAIKAYAYVEANYPEEVSEEKGAWQARSMLGMATALDESGSGEAAQSILKELIGKYPKSNAATIAKSRIK